MTSFSDPWSEAAPFGSDPARPDEHDDVDPTFVFDFQTYDDPDEDAGQRWSTWASVEPLCRGPEPRPHWVVTSQGAIDTDLGILKSGKEADVFLVERADPVDPAGGVVMAAKRYRGTDHRSFHRAAVYTEGRSVKRSRDRRALKRRARGGAPSPPVSGRSPSGTLSSGAGSSASRSPTPCRSTARRS